MDSRSSHSALSACGVMCVFGVCSMWARLCITVCGVSGEESTLEQGNKSERQANRKQAKKITGSVSLVFRTCAREHERSGKSVVGE